MATKSNPEKNSIIIKRYINKYANKKHYRYETIYTLKPDEVAAICDFANPVKSKIFLCFYNFPAEKYDELTKEDIFAFTEGYTQFPHDRIQVISNKMEFGINVCVPARDGIVDSALVNEVLSHELRHAYRAYNEYMDGHISHPIKSKREKIDKKNESIHKYTFSQRSLKYDNLLQGIKNDNTVRDAFNWIGYALTTDEVNAVIASIDAFLFEHNGNIDALDKCRGMYMMQTIYCDYFEYVQKSATDADWEYCRENALYIHNRKKESLSRFKTRYLNYYKNQFKYFDTKVKKLVDKYKMKSAQKKIMNNKLINNHIAKNFMDDMIVI